MGVWVYEGWVDHAFLPSCSPVTKEDIPCCMPTVGFAVTCRQIHTYTHTHIHIQTDTQTHTYIHTYTHTHIYTYAP